MVCEQGVWVTAPHRGFTPAPRLRIKKDCYISNYRDLTIFKLGCWDKGSFATLLSPTEFNN